MKARFSSALSARPVFELPSPPDDAAPAGRGLRRAGLYTPEPGWALFALRVLLATALMGALLVWCSRSIDWIGLRAQPWLRVGLLAGCIGAAVALYFATLLATGLKLRQFIRRG